MGKEEIGLPSGATYLCSVTFSIIPKVVVIVSNANSWLAIVDMTHACYPARL